MNTPQTRLSEWDEFYKLVYQHIRDYANSQYNDKGEDNVTEWSVSTLMDQIYKYYSRHGKNQREGQDQLDLIKIAHYACMAYWKLQESEEKSDNVELSNINKGDIQEWIEKNLDQNKKYSLMIKEELCQIKDGKK